MIKYKSGILLPALLLAGTLAGCTSAARPANTGQAVTDTANTAGVTGNTGTAHVVLWSVNSDGPDFRAILTGAVGDYGPGVTVYPDGSVDPEHTSEVELNLSHGSFRLSIAKLDAAFVQAVGHLPYDAATCSIHGAVTGTAPIVTGSGTRAYRGITGSFTLTISLDEVDIKGTTCNETARFQSQLILIAGTGSVRP
jgi:hypothetical protein